MLKKVLGALMVTAFAAGLQLTSASAQTRQYAGKVVYGQTVRVFRYDPFDLAIGNYAMLNSVYDPILRENSNLRPEPWLATSWEFNKQGTALTLHIRKAVTFHDGQVMNAKDVKWSIQQYQDPANAATIREATLRITKMDVTGPYTLVLHFNAPYPSVFDVLSLIYVINPQHKLPLKGHPAGTGPFVLKRWEPGVQAIYTPYKSYWRKNQPHLSEFVQKIYSDPQAMVAALQAGTINIAMYPSVQDYNRLKDDPKLLAYNGQSCCEVNINFNTKHKPWDSRLVRQAINHAIDRKTFVRIAFHGDSYPICQPIRKGWAHNPHITVDKQCKYDLKLAKQLLVKAGYPHGFTMQALVSSTVMPESVILAQIMKQDLAKIGVKLDILDLEQTAYNNTGDHALYKDMYIQIVGRTNLDPASLFGTTVAYRPYTNVAQYRSPEYEKLIKEGSDTIDPKKRQQIYWKLAHIVVNQAFSLVAAPRPNLFLVNKSVHGFKLSPSGQLYTGGLSTSK